VKLALRIRRKGTIRYAYGDNHRYQGSPQQVRRRLFHVRKGGRRTSLVGKKNYGNNYTEGKRLRGGSQMDIQRPSKRETQEKNNTREKNREEAVASWRTVVAPGWGGQVWTTPPFSRTLKKRCCKIARQSPEKERHCPRKQGGPA